MNDISGVLWLSWGLLKLLIYLEYPCQKILPSMETFVTIIIGHPSKKFPGVVSILGYVMNEILSESGLIKVINDLGVSPGIVERAKISTK